MEEVVWLDGSLTPRSQANLSPFDYGFLYGYGLFETMRAYSGRIFCLEQHLERLSRSVRVLEIDLPFESPDLKKALYAVLRANNLADARLRLTLSGGEGKITPDLSSCRTPTLLIVAGEYIPYSAQIYQQGFKPAGSRRGKGCWC
jgi:branched-chain amino acid aminotransferase